MTDPGVHVEPDRRSVGAIVRTLVRHLLDEARAGLPVEPAEIVVRLDAERAAGRIPAEAPTVAVAEYLTGASAMRGRATGGGPAEIRGSDDRAFVDRTAAASLVLLGLEPQVER